MTISLTIFLMSVEYLKIDKEEAGRRGSYDLGNRTCMEQGRSCEALDSCERESKNNEIARASSRGSEPAETRQRNHRERVGDDRQRSTSQLGRHKQDRLFELLSELEIRWRTTCMRTFFQIQTFSWENRRRWVRGYTGDGDPGRVGGALLGDGSQRL